MSNQNNKVIVGVMSNKINKFFILLLVMVLMSCSKSVDIQLETQVHVFLSDNTEQKILLTQKDEVYVTLNTWLDENKDGWYATSGRYPGGVYIKSGNYGIQVTESKVIIYSTSGNKPKAIYIQDIEKGELNEVINFSK